MKTSPNLLTLPKSMQPPEVKATSEGIENWPEFEQWAARNTVIFYSARHYCAMVGMKPNEFLKLTTYLLILENKELKDRLINIAENSAHPNF